MDIECRSDAATVEVYSECYCRACSLQSPDEDKSVRGFPGSYANVPDCLAGLNGALRHSTPQLRLQAAQRCCATYGRSIQATSATRLWAPSTECPGSRLQENRCSRRISTSTEKPFHPQLKLHPASESRHRFAPGQCSSETNPRRHKPLRKSAALYRPVISP